MGSMSCENSETSSILDQTWFSHIRRPSRYLGNEINSIKKDPEAIEVSIALAFPDIYEVGMSHVGLKILYHILNGCDWLAAERVFCPWVDLEKELQERKLPLTTIESARPLSTFDLVGFSLQHELLFSNLLTMLYLSGIPFLSEERKDSFPLIIAGGPACFNPEPIASFFDAIVIGDGEEAALEICKEVREAKLQKIKRKQDILSHMANIRGVYVPAFFKALHKPDGTIHAVESILPGYKKVEKAVIPDIDQHPFPAPQVVPFTELIHDRLAIEISRGCTRGCRFCQAGMIYRPVRERDPRSVIKNAQRALSLTGYEELSLLSLSSGDYGCLGPLLKELMDRQSEDKIAVSLPSLRVDSLDPFWFEQIKRVRKTGFTLAPEAGNERMRRLINKSMSNEEILNMARGVYGAGWNLLKLYFMIGLPGEEDKDLQDIIYLGKKVMALAGGGGKKAKLNLSLSTFVPKSHTPFMWVPQISLEESRRRIQLIHNAFKNSRVRVKWNHPEMSWFEGIFSRGDRRLSRVLIEAWRMGARFDAWGEHFRMELWKGAFDRSGLDPEFYLYRPRSEEEILPWDHIKSGVTKAYLKKEWKRAMHEKVTPDCRKKCLDCGVCDHKRIDPILFEHWTAPPIQPGRASNHKPPVIKKVRMTFSKTGSARHLSHLELARLFIRAFKRAGLNLVYTKGYHPMPKVSFASALPVGTESIHETVDLQLYGVIPTETLKDLTNRQLPTGIKMTLLEDISHEEKSPKLLESHFCITTNGLRIEENDLEEFLRADYFPITKSGKKGCKVVNARPLVKSMTLSPPHVINLAIDHIPGPKLKPVDIIKEVFHLSDHHINSIKILKTKQVME